MTIIYLIFIVTIVLFTLIFSLKKKTDIIEYEKIHAERESSGVPKILYLRAFNVDGDDGGNGNISILKLIPKERDLAEDLIKLNYHLIAVGKPGEDLPEIGFDRKKFSHSVWQDEVLQLMKKSVLIIWRPDTTPGVLWEFGKLLELNFRHKLVVWCDMGYENSYEIQRAKYNVFCRKVLEQFNEKLPPLEKYKKYLVSETNEKWETLYFLKETPIFKTL